MSLVFCWAVPRSVSTALARSFMQLKAVDVVHEPFTDAFYFGPTRCSARYGDPPKDWAGMPGGVIDSLLARAAVARSVGRVVFVKELAFQGEPFVPDAVLRISRHLFIVRHPTRVLASLIELKRDFTEEELGFKSLARVADRLDHLGVDLRGLDGDALQASPTQVLPSVCEWVGTDYELAMLSWADGRVRDWAPEETQSQARWHRTLETSRGFVRTSRTPVEPPPGQGDTFNRAIDVYQELRARMLTPSHV